MLGHACGSLGPNLSSHRGVEGVGKRQEHVRNGGVSRNGGLSEKHRGLSSKCPNQEGLGYGNFGIVNFPLCLSCRYDFVGK